jgi:HEAT repeat protein
MTKHSVPWLLGEAKDPKNIPELIKFTKSGSANERRLAASALGKFSKGSSASHKVA